MPALRTPSISERNSRIVSTPPGLREVNKSAGICSYGTARITRFGGWLEGGGLDPRSARYATEGFRCHRLVQLRWFSERNVRGVGSFCRYRSYPKDSNATARIDPSSIARRLTQEQRRTEEHIP